ncbi:MAG: hypothetical protein QNJ44_11265 [Rhodobacter sp.]|nr:hypothetical protein [Rhodobacter sp.]
MHKSACAALWRLLLLIGGLSLTACAPGDFSACPIPKDYSQAEQNAAADELDALPEGSVLADFIGDYGVLRAEARACAAG